jgi:hypothetical protein
MRFKIIVFIKLINVYNLLTVLRIKSENKYGNSYIRYVEFHWALFVLEH